MFVGIGLAVVAAGLISGGLLAWLAFALPLAACFGAFVHEFPLARNGSRFDWSYLAAAASGIGALLLILCALNLAWQGWTGELADWWEARYYIDFAVLLGATGLYAFAGACLGVLLARVASRFKTAV